MTRRGGILLMALGALMLAGLAVAVIGDLAGARLRDGAERVQRVQARELALGALTLAAGWEARVGAFTVRRDAAGAEAVGPGGRYRIDADDAGLPTRERWMRGSTGVHGR